MRELRLLDVGDDAEHLVVVDDDGERYRLPIDDALRAAIRLERARLGQLQLESTGEVRPREVQAMIRAGASAEDVARRTGWSLEKISRFDGPVLAERQHVADLGRTVTIRARGHAGRHESLGQRVADRLADRDVDAEDVAWDSARDGDGRWTLTARFEAGGRSRVATWWFDARSMSVEARDDEARWLTEDEDPVSALTDPRRPTPIYDGEAEEARHSHPTTEELIASMRDHSTVQRRGRRTASAPAADETVLDVPDDALFAPPAVPELPAESASGPGSVPTLDEPSADDSDGSDGSDPDADGAAPAPRRKGRPSVPSWDDVMFGSRPGE